MPAPALMLPLAQTASALGWSLVIVVLVAGSFFAIAWLRRWLKEEEVPSGGMGFGLSELRQIHARGEISDAEYERAREKMTSAAKAATAAMPDPAGGRRAPGTTPALSDKPTLGAPGRLPQSSSEPPASPRRPTQ